MATPLEGRAYVVTGSGRGIGSEVAKLIGSLGGSVVVNDPGVNLDGSGSDSGPAAEIAKVINDQGIGKAVANMDTVATEEGGENMIKQAMDEFGRLDGVIHVAGILRDRMVFNMTEQEWDDVVAVHLTGFFNVVKPASIIMRQQRSGRIIGFSSGSGMNGNTGQANYGAAKAGITGGVRCAARDLGRYGVTSNAICPGANTRMTQSVPDASRDLRARAGISGAQRPQSIVNQLRGPEMVAPMTVYLLTDQAWNINGKCFYVNGGNVALAHEETPYRTIAKGGMWDVDELRALVPSQLMQGTANPAPPPADLDLPGRPVAKAE
ncbi:MAG: SDR family oxidoreductase [Dehalococcoidia bacterium]|nr:SDR family oxidoreductase [Dehalococcoidia bacterium]MCA9850228.1 SDR family oxidoreductase [Dehalococcoidia bacterium]MCA9856303.1 SDR family oxidoreductase [Dehalococcoidia bacterium]